MLILTMKKDDEIFASVEGLEQPIRVVCTAIRGNKIRVGFDAPEEVRILRGVLYNKVDSKESSQ